MATYVISDLHGCFAPLLKLLEQINFDQASDRLIFVGDLINRGPQSLETLRFVKNLAEQNIAKTVLGNHDFLLLFLASNLEKVPSYDLSDKKYASLQKILQADDFAANIHWLRKQPLLIEEQNHLIVHAGIPPQWTIEQAKHYANHLEKRLQNPDKWQKLVRKLFETEALKWPKHAEKKLSKWQIYTYIANAFTRMRFCDPKGKLDFKLKQSIENTPKTADYQAWFQHKKRKNTEQKIIFGHWSTLGEIDDYQVHSTDTGCLWGGALTAFRLEDMSRHRLECSTFKSPD